MEKEFYTVKEVAKMLSVVPMTVYRLIERGQIPVHNVGGSKRISRKDLEEYLGRVRTLQDRS